MIFFFFCPIEKRPSDGLTDRNISYNNTLDVVVYIYRSRCIKDNNNKNNILLLLRTKEYIDLARRPVVLCCDSCEPALSIDDYRLIDERFGECKPAFDGHGQRNGSGSQSKCAPKDAYAAEIRGQHPSAGHVELQVHLNGTARHGEKIIPRQTFEHERLTLVARRFVASQHNQRRNVAADAQHVKHRQQRLYIKLEINQSINR